VNFDEKFRKSLVKLYKDVWKEPPWNEFFWTDEMVDEDINYALKQKDFIGKLAVNSGNVKGFTWEYSLPKEKFQFLDLNEAVYIDELAVRKDFRKMGIGTRLTDMLINDARKLGYETVTLRTDINGDAYKFYLDLGFRDMNIKDPKYPERTYMRKTI
jgi:ribosomal protein S18 acetylase RimI-like enzyme